MSPPLPSRISRSEPDAVDACLRDFRTACAAASPPPVAGLRGWLGRVPSDRRPNLLVDLVTVHVAAPWEWAARPTPDKYVEEFGKEYPEFASLAVMPAEVLVADLLARYEADPLRERRTIREYAADFGRPDVVALAEENAAGDGGRYVKLSFIGDGGMGAVWKCHDQRLLRPVAVKFPHEWVIRSPHNRERLADEARLTAVLNHPGIVSVHEFDESDAAAPFYVMRLVRGESLHDLVRDYFASGGGKRGLRDLVQILIGVCETVAYAHSRRILHRDLKPNNIKVGAFGEVTVLDWGLVKLQAAAPGPAAVGGISTQAVATTDTPAGYAGVTPSGSERSGLVGALAYMPPENVQGHSIPASDVFGLGTILYALLAGRPPYVVGQDESRADLLKRVEEAGYPRPRRVSRRPVPRALEAICLKAMARRQEDRYASPGALAADLRLWLADGRVTAHREWPHQSLLRFVRRHTGVSVLTALILIAVAAGAWWWQWDRDQRATAAERELDGRVLAADRELNAIDGLIASGDLDRARTALAGLAAQLHGPDRLSGHLARADRALAQVEARSGLAREREIRIPEFHRRADEAEFHLLGAYWKLLPHEETRTAKTIDFPNPHGADLSKGVKAARQALAMYGLPESAEEFRTLRAAGLAEETVTRLQQRAGDLLFLCSMAVERLAQDGPPDRHTAACREALALLDTAGRTGNDSRSLLLHRAAISTKLGDGADAAAVRAAADRRPDATFLDHHLRGATHSRQKDRQKAVEAYTQALAVRPRDYWTLFRMAKALEEYAYDKADPVVLGQAEATFATCAGLRPEDPTAYNNRADVLCKLAKVAATPAVASRRLDEAVAAGEKTLSVDPTYLMAWSNLALAHAERKDPAAAEDILRRFTGQPVLDRASPAVRREHARVLANVALAYERAKRYEEAVRYNTRSLELDPDDPGTRHNRAVARKELGQLEGAEADIRKAIEIAPDDGGYHFLLGNILHARRIPSDAVRAFDRAIELQPKLWNAWYNRGVARRQLGRNMEAFRDQTQVIKNRPDFALAHYERALLQAMAREYRAALDDADAFLALEPDDVRGLVLRGQIHGDLGKDFERSERDLTRAIELDAKDPGAYRARGLTRARAENWAGAIADYRAYLRLNPKGPDAPGVLNDIAVAHENAGRVEEALEVFGEALALGRTTSLLGNRGNLYLKQGDLRRAAADFDAAIALDPRADRAWGLRAQVRLRTEDWPAAIEDLDRAERLFTGHYELLTLRGFAHYAAGNAAAARKDWAKVVKDRPDHVRGRFCRAGTALLDGKPADAVEGLAQALGDPVLGPYATLLLARAWVDVPGPGPGKATGYAEELTRRWPGEWAAYLEAARVYARAARSDEGVAPSFHNRAIQLLGEAIKRDPTLRDRLASEVAFDSLRKDPRFPK